MKCTKIVSNSKWERYNNIYRSTAFSAKLLFANPSNQTVAVCLTASLVLKSDKKHVAQTINVYLYQDHMIILSNLKFLIKILVIKMFHYKFMLMQFDISNIKVTLEPVQIYH